MSHSKIRFGENSPFLVESVTKKIRMKTIYEIEESKESIEYGVWVGRITSPEVEYIVVA
jgi:hypothetical protein